MKEELTPEQSTVAKPEEQSNADATEASRLINEELLKLQERRSETALTESDDGGIVLVGSIRGDEREQLVERLETLQRQKEGLANGTLKPVEVLLERKPFETVGKFVSSESSLGRVLHVEKEVTALPENERRYVIAHFQNVTKLRELQEQLRVNEEIFGGNPESRVYFIEPLQRELTETTKEASAHARAFWEGIDKTVSPEQAAEIRTRLGNIGERLEQKHYLTRIERGGFDVRKETLDVTTPEGKTVRGFWGKIADTASEFDVAKLRLKRGEKLPTHAENKERNVPNEYEEKRPAKPERNREDMKLEMSVREARDFRELWRVISEAGGLQGSGKFYTVNELDNLVKRVDAKGENPSLLTNAYGFRSKVLDLINLEKIRRELEG
jgi:hypothetical protein